MRHHHPGGPLPGPGSHYSHSPSRAANRPFEHDKRKPPMTKDLARQNELKPMSLCEPCQGIQRNWRKAPGHAELVQRGNRQEDRGDGTVTITRYVCDRCGTAWEYENDRNNQKAGWSVVGR